MTIIKFLKKLLIFILVVFVGIWGYSFFKEKYTQEMNKKYEQETKNMSKNDLKIINEVISLAKEREGQEYTWGGKGEIITKERLEELTGYYGESYYPLEKNDYIGKQGFDCSGLTYWTYKIVTNVNIGYSTTEQKDILKDYKVQMENIQPGDLIFTPGHVVMYIGRGKVINSANRNPYPIGGIKIESILHYNNGQVYRPIDYINGYLK